MAVRDFWKMHLLPSGFAPLHGLRILAILTVFQVHVTGALCGRGLLHSKLTVFSVTCIFGMDFFFFLSGFLIGTLLLDRPLQGTRDLGRFYARRQFRIVPLYFFVLALLSLARGTFPNAHELVYLTNYPPRYSYTMFWSWSLSVEEHFYLVAPFLFLFLTRVLSPRRLAVVMALLWLSGGVVRSFMPDPFVQYHATHARYDILAAGMLMAIVVRHGRERLVSLMRRRWVRGACLAGCALLLARIAIPTRLPPAHYQHEWYYVPCCWHPDWEAPLIVGTYTGLAYMLLFAWLFGRTGSGWPERWLGNRTCRAIATLGYGMYLVHIPVSLALVRFLPSSTPSEGLCWGMALAGVFFVSLAVAYLLHILVEKPMLALRDRLVP